MPTSTRSRSTRLEESRQPPEEAVSAEIDEAADAEDEYESPARRAETEAEDAAPRRRGKGWDRRRRERGGEPRTGRSELIEIGGLWETETRTGALMLSGRVGRNMRLLILENRGAKGKQPDFRAFWAPGDRDEAEGEDSAPEEPEC